MVIIEFFLLLLEMPKKVILLVLAMSILCIVIASFYSTKEAEDKQKAKPTFKNTKRIIKFLTD